MNKSNVTKTRPIGTVGLYPMIQPDCRSESSSSRCNTPLTTFTTSHAHKQKAAYPRKKINSIEPATEHALLPHSQHDTKPPYTGRQIIHIAVRVGFLEIPSLKKHHIINHNVLHTCYNQRTRSCAVFRNFHYGGCRTKKNRFKRQICVLCSKRFAFFLR